MVLSNFRNEIVASKQALPSAYNVENLSTKDKSAELYTYIKVLG